jgi:hypothetical protein
MTASTTSATRGHRSHSSSLETYLTGDWGANNTAFIFNEHAAGNIRIYNNLFIMYPAKLFE